MLWNLNNGNSLVIHNTFCYTYFFSFNFCFNSSCKLPCKFLMNPIFSLPNCWPKLKWWTLRPGFAREVFELSSFDTFFNTTFFNCSWREPKNRYISHFLFSNELILTSHFGCLPGNFGAWEIDGGIFGGTGGGILGGTGGLGRVGDGSFGGFGIDGIKSISLSIISRSFSSFSRFSPNFSPYAFQWFLPNPPMGIWNTPRKSNNQKHNILMPFFVIWIFIVWFLVFYVIYLIYYLQFNLLRKKTRQQKLDLLQEDSIYFSLDLCVHSVGWILD